MAPVDPSHVYNACICNRPSQYVDAMGDCSSNEKVNDEYMNLIRKLIVAKTSVNDSRPFFVMNTGLISAHLDNWYSKMPNVTPFYSMRCNSDHVLLKLLTENTDVGLCCTGRLELETALSYADTDRIIYANPLWTRANIRYAKEWGIQTVILESEDDLNRFATYFPEANIILRVIMDQRLASGPITMVDDIDVEKATILFRKAKDLAVKIVGVSFSIRTDCCPSATLYSYAVGQCRRLFDIGFELGFKMNILDLGNGFPSPTSVDGITFDQIAGSLRAAFSLFFPSKLFGHLKVIAEPGPYFAASPYSLITRIIDKRLVNASVITNDASDAGNVGYVYQINEGFYGAFGCKLSTHRTPTCSALMSFGGKLNTYAAIVGPESCDEDVIVSLTRLPPLQVGDWLIWHDMGAYTMNNCGKSNGDGLPTVDVHYYEVRETRTFVNLASLASSNGEHIRTTDHLSSQLDRELDNYTDPVGNITAELGLTSGICEVLQVVGDH